MANMEDSTSDQFDQRFLLQSLMDHIPDSIYFKDTEGRFIQINRAKAERSGLASPKDAVGKTDFDFFQREHAEKAMADERRIMSTRQPLIESEEHLVWPNGLQRWVSSTKLPLENSSGEVVGTFGISRDITKLKTTEMALEHAKEIAETASRAKSEFVANMSHEIRTPMNGVIGMAELLLDTSLNASQREYTQMILESGETLLSLLNDVLDFSKIEAGKIELDPVPFSIRDCIGSMMKSLAVRAHRKQLELAYHIDSRIPDVLVGDFVRLRQVLVNLIGNAIKFTETGEVFVDVILQNEDNDVITAKFVVRDTGIGIPADKLGNIFTEFEQVDKSTTRRYGGTGLGLAIATRFVRLMGGQLAVESKFGEGTEFSFVVNFPVSQSKIETKPRAIPASIHGKRVLIVDDNATNRRILQEMLKNWGIDFLAVSDANKALQQTKAAFHEDRPFNLIISDVNMPDMDGFDLVEAIRNDKDMAATKIMLLTSGMRTDDAHRAEEMGVQTHLMKPVKQSEMLNAITAELGESCDSEDTESAHLVADNSLSDVDPDTPTPNRELKVLVAEDSLVNQKLATAVLQRFGHSVKLAVNGVEAVEMTAAESFDLVLMDVEMPEMDGLQATQAIRQREEQTGTHLPIIAMTAHAMQGDQDRCLAAGMDAYVAKPMRQQALLDAITNLINQDETSDTKSKPIE
jgi:PAS domain S-box-containing protein